MSGSDTQQATQSQSVTQLPPWINQAAQQNYAFAQNVANRPMQQYQGQMVADVGPQTQQGWNLAAQGGGAGQDQYNASQAGYLGVMGQQPQQVTPQQLSSTDLQPYMNPYTQSVINTTLPIMQQNLALSQNQQQNAANSANAFGGSRQAIQQGVTQAQGALGMGQMAAQLNQANFGQAQAAATGDISRNLSAQQLNQAAQQNQAGLNVQAAQGLGALGNQAQLSQARNFAELQTAGAQQQQQAQAQINAQMGKFQQAWGYPGTQLGVLQSALGMTPYGQAQQGQSTTQNTFTPDYAAAALTGLQTVGSLFGGGGMFGAGGAFGPTSDRRLKTDIKKVGDHPAGVPLFSYRYKGDPKTYPKVVGPMAEDVMKIAPHAVRPIPGTGGKMAVDPNVLGALAPPSSRRPALAMNANARGLPPAGMMPPAGLGPPAGMMPPGGVGPPAGAMPPLPPPMPGALSPPGVVGAIGPLGATMRAPQAPRIRKPRLPPIRGALGG